MKQVATFLYALTDGSGLRVQELRLRSPHGDVAPDVWDAETTVTYLMYAPGSKKTAPKG